MEYFKLWGPERSTTNFLGRILVDNVQEYQPDSKVKDGPWKHGLPPEDLEKWCEDHPETKMARAYEEGNLTFFFCLKDPYMWIVSYLRGFEKGHLLPDHYEENGFMMDQFVEQMAQVNRNRDIGMLKNNEVFLRQAVRKYNQLVSAYREFNKEHPDISEFVTYDELLNDLPARLSEIVNNHDLTLRDDIRSPSNEVITGGEVIQDSYDTSYWTENQYWRDITDLMKTVVDEETNWMNLSVFGYEKQESSPAIHLDTSMKIAAWGDWSQFTGFGRVMKGIFHNVPSDWEIEVIGINFDPSHPRQDDPENITVYSAGSNEKNPYGPEGLVRYLKETDFEYDLVFVLQDGFILSAPVGTEKGEIPFIKGVRDVVDKRDASLVGYTPVDAPRPQAGWYEPFISQCHQPVTYTEWARESIRNVISRPNMADELDVIYHGTDPDYFYPLESSKAQQMRDELELDDDDFAILFLGANQRRKDIPRSVMETFARLYKERPNAKLLLKTQMQQSRNAGWNLGFIREQICELHRIPKDRIRFVNEGGFLPINVINRLYNAVDCLYLPSLEGWGLPVTEAYLTETPTVVGDHGATSEIGEDGRSIKIDVPQDLEHRTWYTDDNNVYRSVIDSDDFVDKVSDLMDNRDDYDDMVELAKEWALENRWGNIAEEWVEVFREQAG